MSIPSFEVQVTHESCVHLRFITGHFDIHAHYEMITTTKLVRSPVISHSCFSMVRISKIYFYERWEHSALVQVLCIRSPSLHPGPFFSLFVVSSRLWKTFLCPTPSGLVEEPLSTHSFANSSGPGSSKGLLLPSCDHGFH